jgi:hypothetical protein
MPTTLPSLSPADLAAEFSRLADRWTEQTEHLSNPNQRILHRDYQRIIGLGPDVLPLLLRRLKDDPDDWFHALTAVTGYDPIKREHAGKLDLMVRDWLEWAQAHGINV